MMKGTYLGELEELILLTVGILYPQAYGVAVMDEIEEQASRSLNISAGSGLEHSEKNASATADVNFLQIWVFPKEKNITPRYDQKAFKPEDRINKFETVVSPEKEGKALWINQDAWFSLGNLQKGSNVEYILKNPAHGVYVFVIEGDVNVNGQLLNKRDGFGVSNSDKLTITGVSDAEVLLIEVPMTSR